jgi:hypothetical protein
MSNKKQTAVEWLYEQLNGLNKQILDDYFQIVFSQAKEIEKQQIINADLNGSIRTAKAIDYRITQLRIKELAEQYYNETFKQL